MIKTLIKSARTEDEAVNLALAELGLDRDDVSVEILTRSKSGFLGIGACNAEVKVSYEVPDPKPEKEIKPEQKKDSFPVLKAKDEQPAAEKKADKPSMPKQEKKKGEKKPDTPAVKKAAKADNTPAPKADAVKADNPAVTNEPEEYAAIRSFLSGLLEKMGVSRYRDKSARGCRRYRRKAIRKQHGSYHRQTRRDSRCNTASH